MNNYHLLDQIGEGSFGRVYKARRKFTGRIVAIKMINKRGQSKEDLASFRREMDILKVVNHPNIMRHIEVFENNSDFCLVSELARGDLFKIIDDNQTLPEDVLKSIAAQLVSALTHLHQQRIIHRDMKPQNVLVCAHGSIKVCDFGFARALSQKTLVLTSIKGTPIYMAPELVQEQPYDEKVDVWSLGVILYELFFGRPPFFTNSIYKLIQMIVNEKVTFPGPISDEFKDFLLQMLQKNPQNRSSCAGLLTHPFISKVPLTPYDDSEYRNKKKEFDLAIEESLSETSSLRFQLPESSEPDYQGILLNPSNHSAEDLLVAVKHLNDNEINDQSPLAMSFATHFTEFISKPLVAEEALKAATQLLKQNLSTFLGLFKVGISILGEPDMPRAAIDFFTELLVIPYALKIVDSYDLVQDDLHLDDEKAEKLRDKLLSFLFTSDPVEGSKTYSFLSFLVQVSPIFVNAISGQFVSNVVPIITSSVIHRTSSPVTAGALAILSKILEKNGASIQYIQPISEFVDSFFSIFKEIPDSLESFSVFSAAISFLSVSYNLISQLSDFQRLFNLSTKPQDLVSFIPYLYEDVDKLYESLLKFGCDFPVTQFEYLSFVSILSSPFSHVPLSSVLIGKCITHINSLIKFHQPSLLQAIFNLPITDIINSLSSLVHLYDVPSCMEPFSEFLLNQVKSNDQLISPLISASVPLKLSQLIGLTKQDYSKTHLLLLIHIILLSTKENRELLEQCPYILSTVFSIESAYEAALIIASHFARLSDEFNPILEKEGVFPLCEKCLSSENPNLRGRSLNVLGNLWKNAASHDEIEQNLFGVTLNLLKSEKDMFVRKQAMFAIGNLVYNSPEYGDDILKEIDFVLKVLDDANLTSANYLDICDSAVGIICNLLHKDGQFINKLSSIGAFDRLFAAISKGKDLGPRVLSRITALCKYEETRKILKLKTNKAIIQKFNKHQNEEVKNIAISILKIIDA